MKTKIFIIISVIFLFPLTSKALMFDTDGDGLTDEQEVNIFKTDPTNKDSDGDGYEDGNEVRDSYDPSKNESTKIPKSIVVDISEQKLTYFLGNFAISSFKISSGKNNSTPLGQFKVLKKRPLVNYVGSDYNFPNTKWNLLFKYNKAGNYYIHGVYWHTDFGKPVSHGCVNVSYDDMENLYNWADEGTKINIIK